MDFKGLVNATRLLRGNPAAGFMCGGSGITDHGFKMLQCPIVAAAVPVRQRAPGWPTVTLAILFARRAQLKSRNRAELVKETQEICNLPFLGDFSISDAQDDHIAYRHPLARRRNAEERSLMRRRPTDAPRQLVTNHE